MYFHRSLGTNVVTVFYWWLHSIYLYWTSLWWNYYHLQLHETYFQGSYGSRWKKYNYPEEQNVNGTNWEVVDKNFKTYWTKSWSLSWIIGLVGSVNFKTFAYYLNQNQTFHRLLLWRFDGSSYTKFSIYSQMLQKTKQE